MPDSGTTQPMSNSNPNFSDEIMGAMHLFMVCHDLNASALRPLPDGFSVRTCRPDEVDLWKGIHFNTPEDRERYKPMMTEYFDRVYAPQADLFHQRCLFACDAADTPVGTVFVWKAYAAFNSIHWFKVARPFEGRGLGRALLSIAMQDLTQNDYPVYLHTHPTSYRAIKLYSDFGFKLISDPVIGYRPNNLQDTMPYLQQQMPTSAFAKLDIVKAPTAFMEAVAGSTQGEF